jgi:hypothetical protein
MPNILMRNKQAASAPAFAPKMAVIAASLPAGNDAIAASNKKENRG